MGIRITAELSPNFIQSEIRNTPIKRNMDERSWQTRQQKRELGKWNLKEYWYIMKRVIEMNCSSTLPPLKAFYLFHSFQIKSSALQI